MASTKSPEEEHPVKTFGWAARDSSGVLSPFKFSRRKYTRKITEDSILGLDGGLQSLTRLIDLAPALSDAASVRIQALKFYKPGATGEKDVRFKILYCGICHSDLHIARNELGWTTYPLVPGHEMVGTVTEVGSKVTKFAVGDTVGVGCLVGSCGSCDNCCSDLENYCPKFIMTYQSVDYDGTVTRGGYANEMVADEHFVIRIPENLPLAAAAPLLCAGITVYSPMRYFGFDKPGSHIGIVGLGGLGHVAVKFAKAFGVKVTVISTSPSKKDEAINLLGADEFLVSRDPDQMRAASGTMDRILDTVSANHPIMPLIDLLKTNGQLVLVGLPDKPFELAVFPLILGRKGVNASSIGGLKETQEMIDFAAKHNISAEIELVPMDYVNTAFDRLAKNDVKYRFVLDIANTMVVP